MSTQRQELAPEVLLFGVCLSLCVLCLCMSGWAKIWFEASLFSAKSDFKQPHLPRYIESAFECVTHSSILGFSSSAHATVARSLHQPFATQGMYSICLCVFPVRQLRPHRPKLSNKPLLRKSQARSDRLFLVMVAVITQIRSGNKNCLALQCTMLLSRFFLTILPDCHGL